MNEQTPAPIGHNRPPWPLDDLRAELELRSAALIARRDELLAGAERAPGRIQSDADAGRTGDLIKLLTQAGKSADAARVAAKEPHLEAGRAVDGFFATIIDPLKQAKTALQLRLDRFLTEKAAAARKAAEEEAAKARAEAERLAVEAAARETASRPIAAASFMDEAIAKEKEAQRAAEVATARPAELSRTRGDYGSISSLRTTWTYEIVDLALVPRAFLMPNDAAIKAHIKGRAADQPPAAVAGIRFVEKSTATVR